MTTVDKLLVQGIRSFGPHKRNVIDFYTPLTLIVGQNGAGKTTIIECLKYACTGELPPNCKNGQAFVHDTKVAGEREVKAQIKLRFRNAAGKPIVVTRSLSLVQKQTKQEFNTIDSALQTFNSVGERVSQSFRCSDLDKEIPDLMGVSKPIIEHVIFCHQESSNWPLTEGAKVKARFDEIFAATRYTKALEVIKKQKKEQTAQFKELKMKLEILETNKEHATKLKKDIENFRNQVSLSNKDIAALNESLVQLDDKLAELKAKKESVRSMINEVNMLKGKKQQSEQNSEQVYQGLEVVFEETDEELKLVEQKFNSKLEKLLTAEKSTMERVQHLQNEKKRHEALRSELSLECGKLQTNLQHQQDLITNRDKQIKVLLKKYSISVPFELSSQLTSKTVSDVVGLLDTQLDELRSGIQTLKAEIKASNDAFQSSIDKATQEKLQAEERSTLSRRTKEENNRKIENLKADNKQKHSYQNNLGSIESQLTEEQELLEKLKDTFTSSNYDAKIEETVHKKQEVDKKMVEMGEVMKTLTLHSSSRVRLGIKKSEAQAKQASYDARLESKRPEITKLLGHAPEPSQAKTELQFLLSRKKKEHFAATEAQQEAKMELSSLQGEIKALQTRSSALETDLKSKRAKIRKVTADTDKTLPELIEEANATLLEERRLQTMIKSADLFYKSFIEDGRKDRCCPLCTRDFEKEVELYNFLGDLEKRIAKIPSSMEQAAHKVKQAEELTQNLANLRTDYEDMLRIESEIPSIDKKIGEYITKATKLEKVESQESAKLHQTSQEEKETTDLLQEIEEMTRLLEELNTLNREIRDEEAKLKRVSADSRTPEEVSKQYDSLQNEGAVLNRTMDLLRKESQEIRTKISKHEEVCFKFRDEIAAMKGMTDKIAANNNTIKTLLADNEQYEHDIRDNDDKVKASLASIQNIVQNRNKVLKELEAKETSMQAKREAMQSQVQQIENLHKQIEMMGPQHLQDKLQQATEARAKAEATIAQTDSDLKKCSEALDAMKEKLAQRNMTKRTITDNLRYREGLGEILTLENEIRKREKHISNTLPQNVDAEIMLIQKEFDGIKQQHDILVGKKQTWEEQSRHAEGELKKPQYKTVEEEHRAMLIKVKTTEMALSDLEKYYRALDKALMRYHAMKMEEINKIIKELWQATYKGNDIDTIEMKSDVETSSTTNKRTYQYRVVMLKGDIELDMRGRCSAGQKVLASLVIRLALAETFCLNCGILALDEPTTNLDRYNVESFANALVSIIESRRAQRHFQLIVITHDEEFVQLLGRSEHADYYWRVSKDPNGHSSIERQDIRDLS
eukprot:Phypoly_transcript_00774.p1 GENE.Phypoly_transcript_00774~~Phypoly_transcript_00774.p1  ORF type:complete len:1313 (+),score=243.76 Phypoly_transcript_00774:90-4028(+)